MRDARIGLGFLALSATLHLPLVSAAVTMAVLAGPIVVLVGPVPIVAELLGTGILGAVAAIVITCLGALLPAAAQVARPWRPTFRWLALPLCVVPTVCLLWTFVPSLALPLLPLVHQGPIWPVGL